MLNGLSLFTGIGGIDLALSEWVRPVAYCEIDVYAAGVLFSRMLDGAIPTAPIFPDVRQLTADILPSIDIVFGGFPCQDISLAGARAGLDGERSGLFWQIVRLTAECRPAWVFLENVPGIKPYRQAIHTAFEELGYTCRDGTLAAGHLGACHIRNRWWFVAHLHGAGLEEQRKQHNGERQAIKRSGEADAAHAASNGRQRSGLARQRRDGSENGDLVSHTNGKPERRPTEPRQEFCSWPTEPSVYGADARIPRRVDRIKCLGNAVHVLTAKEAFKRLIGL